MVKKCIKILSIIILLYSTLFFIGYPPFVKIDNKLVYCYKSEFILWNSDTKNLKYMKNLEILYILSTEITDITFLNNFKKLKSLSLQAYSINNLEILSNLNELEELCLWNGHLNNLSLLKENKSLKILDLATGNSIQDISDVKYLTNLEVLYINGNNITDISSLKYCTQLKTLVLYGTNTSSYSEICGLKNLRTLCIEKNKLTSEELKILKEKGVNVTEIGK